MPANRSPGSGHSRVQTRPCPAPPTTIEGLTPGLVVFCTRPSFMARLNASVGDEWRHVGIVVETADGGLAISGVGRLAKHFLMPLDALRTYSRVGVASVFASATEIELAQTWAAGFDGSKVHYPSSAVPMAGLLSWARTANAPVRRAVVVRLAHRYCMWMSRQHVDDRVFICSTYVAAAMNAASPEPVRFAMTEQKRTATRPDQVGLTATLLARWLATPSDLWRAIPAEQRAEVSLGD